MKTSMFLIALAAAGLMFTGCSDDDDNISVDPALETAFRAQYPDAGWVSWEKKSGYFVAEFRRSGNEAEAWYDAGAKWYLTETDIPYDALPQPVKDSHESGEYAAWRIDDVDMLEGLEIETVYVIEVEQGKQEYDLYYSADGVLVKSVADGGSSHHEPSTLLPAIKEFITAKYPQARIVDVENEHNGIEVDIIDGSTPRELMFSKTGEWMYTKTEVRRSNVPAVVSAALANSQYGSWKIDDVDFYETPAGNYYRFEVESGNQEVYVKISPEGNILP